MPSYKTPRRINLVSTLVTLAIVGGGYAAWKFVPIYITVMKVDSILSDIGYQSADLHHQSEITRRKTETKLLDAAVTQIVNAGVEDPELYVQYDPAYTEITATYQVIVEHPFDQRTVLQFERKGRIPE